MSEDFNIFSILTVGNQELTHSAMIRFLFDLSNGNMDLKDNLYSFFEFDKIEAYEVQLEKSYKYAKKKLRYDIVFFDAKNLKEPSRCIVENKFKASNLIESPRCIIENKFKATPSVGQLKLYDQHLQSIQSDQILKVLLVFDEKQIPSDVVEYCEEKKWKVKGYFGNKGLLNEFNDLFSSSAYSFQISQKELFLVNQYFEYLKLINCQVEKYTKSEDYIRYADAKTIGVNFINQRELYFRYLLSIQSETSLKLTDYKFKSTNDGGKNNIPSIAFWFDLESKSTNRDIKEAYFGIDGDSIKIGFSYPRNISKENPSSLEGFCSNLKFNDTEVLIAKKQNFKIKSNSDDSKISVFSPFTFQIQSNQKNKKLIIDEFVSIIVQFVSQLESSFNINLKKQ